MNYRKFKRYIPCIVVVIVMGIIILSKSLYNNQILLNDRQISKEKRRDIEPSLNIIKLESGLSATRYDKDYGFNRFLEQGGASSDEQLVDFISRQFVLESIQLNVNPNPFGCSTLSVKGEEGYLFGRNFDWNTCEAMVIVSHLSDSYSSISTVNMDFISSELPGDIFDLSDQAKSIIALYAPLDGMNEMGLSVSVNMIQDFASIDQNTSKPDLTTTTAVRLILNQAANVDEAISLLDQYDLHASMNMMVHFAISDTTGKSVVVEYINNQMMVTKTPVVTNFYLSEGEKYGIGSSQSHERYDILMQNIEKLPVHTISDVKNALDSVSKDNFDEFESTEWSVIYNQSTGEAHYYHREDYKQSYVFNIKK